MSQLLDFIFFIIVCPLLSILLSSFLNFLTRMVCTFWQSFLSNPQTTPSSTPEPSEDIVQESFYERISYLIDVFKLAWTLLISILDYPASVLQPLRLSCPNTTSESSVPPRSVGPSMPGDGSGVDLETESTQTDILESGRAFSNIPFSETGNINRENSDLSSASIRFGSNCKRTLKPNNWYGDTYRMQREAKVPDDVWRYGRPASYFTNSSCPHFLECRNTPQVNDPLVA